jgi:hypothetical protein
MDASGTPSSTGTLELVVGTGGHAAGAFVTTDTRVLAKSNSAGALRLLLSRASASISFVSSSGSVLDSTSVTC